VVDGGARALAAGDLPALGRAFDENQRLLAGLGVSTVALDSLVVTARRAGALGAKLTGGGGGGAVIALAPDAETVARALESHAARTLLVQVGP
jgi:mevalonate kinase